jgi:hypothetical protein
MRRATLWLLLVGLVPLPVHAQQAPWPGPSVIRNIMNYGVRSPKVGLTPSTFYPPFVLTPPTLDRYSPNDGNGVGPDGRAWLAKGSVSVACHENGPPPQAGKSIWGKVAVAEGYAPLTSRPYVPGPVHPVEARGVTMTAPVETVRE